MPQNNAAGEIDNDVGLPCVTNKKVPTSDVKIAQKPECPGAIYVPVRTVRR